MRNKKGFTLIELLVVVAIMAILMTISISIYSGAQKSARLAKRVSDLKSIETAIELYRSEHDIYPIATSWRSECSNGGNLSSEQVVPGLVPKYLKIFPSDPRMDKALNKSCYMYISNDQGTGYKIIDYNIDDFVSDDYFRAKALIDPARDGGEDSCNVDGTTPTAWGFYTYNACAL